MKTPAFKVVLFFAAICIALCVTYPPWLSTFDLNGQYGAHSVRPFGHHFLLTPPAPEQSASAYGIKLDLQTLLLEFLAVVTLSLIVLLLWPIAKWLLDEFFFGHTSDENQQPRTS